MSLFTMTRGIYEQEDEVPPKMVFGAATCNRAKNKNIDLRPS